MRTWERRVLAAVAEGDKATAVSALPTAYKHLDQAAGKRILHPNTAANHKSRLARKVASLG